MKEALFYKKLKDNIVQCSLCPKNCVIKEDERGNCGVRENIKGRLFSLVYGKACSIAVDPIEKKPLYHFLPGTKAFSIGTVGCNLHCKHCQNWSISQAKPEQFDCLELSPKDIIDEAKRQSCNSVAYTYTEPTVFWEYVLDCAEETRKAGLKNVIVSNGFINEEPLKEGCKYIDAANIDIKGNAKFYREYTDAFIEPVLNTLKILQKKKVWFEITNLLIPGLNDSKSDLKERCKWIRDNLGNEIPVHFSRFFPCYKLINLGPTPLQTLKKAEKIAREVGLKYIHLGNI